MVINRSDSIGVFQFEGNVNTSDNGGTNGIVTGTTQYNTGLSGRCFDFDGSTIINIGESGLSNSSDLTVFLRMNLDSHSTGDAILAKKTSGVTDGFLFQMATAGTDTMRFIVRNAANSAWVEVNDVMPENTVYAVRLQIDLGNEITMDYYTTDGVLTTNSTAFSDSTYTSNSDNITLGNQTSGNACDGEIDDVCIFTSLLTDEDFYRYYLGLGVTDL